MRTSNRIAAQTRVEGAVETHDDLVVEGHLIGSLSGTGDVTVAQQGIVEADVHVRRLVVHGVVVGSIAATDSVQVGPRAQIKGDIRTQQLTLEAGGRIAGQVKTGVSVDAPRSNRSNRFARRDPVPVEAPRTEAAPRREAVETKPASEAKGETGMSRPVEEPEAKPVEAKADSAQVKTEQARPTPAETPKHEVVETDEEPRKHEVVETDDEPSAHSLGYGTTSPQETASDKKKPEKA